ncbi:MAG: hypothetical protein ABR964_01480 [Tepidisphaeraceae bacterium]|jgi:hypothetical protein
MELDEPSAPFVPMEDRRPRLEEPLPVRLVAVADCRLTATAGLEWELDDFYLGLLGFERDLAETTIVYRADNHRLRFEILERMRHREDLRALGITVPSLGELAQRLIESEIEFVHQRGLVPGMNSLLMSDPAGNPLEVGEHRAVF